MQQATVRLYDEDAYLNEFEARVLSCGETEGGYAVVLDRTAFFPEAGGQTPDRGTITDGAGAHVHILDVQIDEAAGVITEEFRPGKTPTLTPEELAQRMEALKADYGHTIEEIRKFAAAQQS